jgi:hypothetical protein
MIWHGGSLPQRLLLAIAPDQRSGRIARGPKLVLEPLEAK